MRGFFKGMDRALAWSVRTLGGLAIERHDFIEKYMLYIMPSNKIWWVFLALASAGEIFSFLDLIGVGIALLFVFILILFKKSNIPAPISIVIWEYNAWVAFLVVIISITETRDQFANALIHFFVWILYSYLVTDIGRPPRKRKKIKVRLKVKAEKPAYEFITR